MHSWHTYTWSDVVKELDSDINIGLKEYQVELSRKRYGDNKILDNSNIDFMHLLLDIMKKPWIIIMIASAFAVTYLESIIYGVIILLIMLASISLILAKYIKKQKDYNILKRMDHYYTSVIRDGKIQRVPTEEIVVGDIVFIKQGKIIPADLRIIDCEDLMIDETSIIEKSYISEKYTAKIEEKDISLSEMKNIAFKSTTIVKGKCTGIVIDVGMNTKVGRIINILSEVKDKDMELKNNIEKYMNFFVLLSAVAVTIIIIMGVISGQKINKIILDSVSIILCSIPFTVFIIINISIIFIKKLFGEKQIYLKDFSAIENISKIDTVCFNKLGVISEEDIFVSSVYTNGNILYLLKDNCIQDENYERMLNIALLCNNARYDSKHNFFKGDLSEIALIKFGTENSFNKSELSKDQNRIFQIPFDFEKGITTTINKVENKYRANVKGLVDKIIERCTYIMKDGIEREITPEDIRNIKDADIEMSSQSMQAMGFAYRNFSYLPTKDENIESYLVFVGLTGFINPLKSECVKALKYSKSLNVNLVMITEDSKLTASSVCENIGFVCGEENILCGVEIDNMDDEEFSRNVEKTSVFSRINPDHMLKIVNILKSLEHKIAVTGSKLTDLPYMESADISIAIGNECNNVIKMFSDCFFEDSNIYNIINIIDISRKSIYSLIEMVTFIFVCTLGLSTYSLIGIIFFNKMPVSVVQILFIEIINAIIALAFFFIRYKKRVKVIN